MHATAPSVHRRACLLGCAAGVAAWLLPPRRAGATVGGPRELELLGHDRSARVLWLLEHFHDESGASPALLRLDLTGSRAGVLRVVEPAREDADPTASEQRVDTLRAALEPLTALAVDDFALDVFRLGTYLETPRGSDEALHAHALRLAVYPRSRPDLRAATAVVAYERSDVRLVAAWGIPRIPWALVVARYVGIPVELLYDRDAAWLLPLARSAG